MRLANKTAIVTGAANGIGWATAAAFLHHGAKVTLLDANEAQALELLKTIPVVADNAYVVNADVSDAHSVNAAVAAAESHFGDTHILFNCAAALTPPETVEHMILEDWNRAFQVNVTGAF